MKPINILRELQREEIEFRQNEVVREALSILHDQVSAEHNVMHRLKNPTSATIRISQSRLHGLDLFSAESIEAICTRYRLRFLDSDLFVGEVPEIALQKVRILEQRTGVHFNRFKIIAPATQFALRDSTEDPLLLGELPNGKYCLVHTWGEDMRWITHVVNYPLQHMGTLAVCSLLVGAIITLAVPQQFDSLKAEFFFRFFMFSMTSALSMTLAIIYGISTSKDFSENVWNSRYIR